MSDIRNDPVPQPDQPQAPQQAPAPEVAEPETQDVPAREAEVNPNESETNPG